MIIAEKTNSKVVQSHDFEQVNCTIDAEDMRYVASLLRNNYSNTQLAVVREISANALDANKEAGSTRPIEVKLPTQLNPNFVVRDFGGGLSEEDVFGLYSKYGKSTKRDSNNYIGAFGIGKFAPLSYGDNFTCVSYHGGMKTSYNVFVNDDDDTKIAKLFEEPSDEPTGLSIEVAVADSDRTNFREIVMKFFRFFDDSEMPKFVGLEENEVIKRPSNSIESAKGNWFVLDEEGGHNYYYRKSHVIMGRVAYPLDGDAVNVDNFISNEKSKTIVKNLIREGNFYLRMPIGSIKLHHSREALEYNKSTQKALCRALYEASEEILEIAKLKLADSADLFEAKVNHAKIVNSLSHSLRNLFDNAFEWNGVKIGSSRFTRIYDEVENLTLTQMNREKDSDSRNGYRVKTQKVSSIFCQEDGIFMIQNIASAHGNNLRARTIFNENEDINVVYVIRPLNDEGWNYINQEWDFNLVSDEHKLFSDNVEKEKPVRNKVTNGQSRASIPLFKMKHDTKYLYRNADYWQNVNNPINSLEADEIEGSVEDKLIYVPITRFTIDIEGWDLERVGSTAKFIRNNAEEDSELSKFTIMGVRKGDVKKLGDNWISWLDFLLDHYKQIIEDNMVDMTDCYIRNSINSAEHDKSNKIKDVLNAHNGILTCDQIDWSKFADDHLLLTLRSYKRIMDSARVDNHYQKLQFVAFHDAEWLNEKFSSVKVDIDSIVSNAEEFQSNYPHLSMLDDAYHYYNRRNHHTHGDMTIKVQDYISLCDNQRGEGE
tara:strand:- start:1064 stop:3367 length:2304 start_codon:yes stop_codon:yes gene_type:complete